MDSYLPRLLDLPAQARIPTLSIRTFYTEITYFETITEIDSSMPHFDWIETDLTNGVYQITLNRPDKLNSFTAEMASELQEAFSEAESNTDIRCVLLTGNGKAFCAGQDLAEVVENAKNPDYTLGDTVHGSYNPVVKAIRNLEKPVICAINGTAAGAGANIAFACDIVVAADHAKFIQSFANIGLIPDSGGTFFLPRLVGLPRATAMAFLDERITAEKAVEIGLIYKSVPAENLMEEVLGICNKLAGMPTRGFGLTKRGFNAAFANNLDTQLNLEADLQTEAGRTHDYNEGVQAFLEKRKPNFKGE